MPSVRLSTDETTRPASGLVCSVCGTLMIGQPAICPAHTAHGMAAQRRPDDKGAGSSFRTDTLIMLEVEGMHVILPPTPTIVVGRVSLDAKGPVVAPDIDLTPFGAYDKGMS